MAQQARTAGKEAPEALSSSLEDYLEAIYELGRSGPARVADIARARGVSMASVCQAMRKLAVQGLVSYRAGEEPCLTHDGLRRAQLVSATHRFLVSFLRDILAVEPSTAEKDACAMEHVLSPDTISHLIAFSQFQGAKTCDGSTLSDAFARSEPTGCATPAAAGRGCRAGAQGPSLAAIRPGDRARIVHLHASCAIRRRLAELGLLPGVEVELVRKAPFGGPVEVAMDGCSISLRRGEAASVEVEPAE